ncbi:hypothetical protein ABTE27_20220, partial [Acinetobacter baumannii]
LSCSMPSASPSPAPLLLNRSDCAGGQSRAVVAAAWAARHAPDAQVLPACRAPAKLDFGWPDWDNGGSKSSEVEMDNRNELWRHVDASKDRLIA